MKALSVRAPWWWFILYAGKDIENRDWYTGFRGTVYLHASKWFGKQEVYDEFMLARECMMEEGIVIPTVSLRDLREIGGHLVGTVDIVDCVQKSDSRWFSGKFGFVLANPKPLVQPIPCKGALGFFEPSILPSDAVGWANEHPA